MPALMLMAMGVTPLSWSCRVWRGRGHPPARLPSLPEEPWDNMVPDLWAESSLWMRWMLFFSLMVGRHFFFRMPGGL